MKKNMKEWKLPVWYDDNDEEKEAEDEEKEEREDEDEDKDEEDECERMTWSSLTASIMERAQSTADVRQMMMTRLSNTSR